MSKDEAIALFVALCGHPRARFKETPLAMCGSADEGFWSGTPRCWRHAAIITDMGDRFEMILADGAVGYRIQCDTIIDYELSVEEYAILRKAYDVAGGQRDVAKVDDVKRMLGLIP